MPIIVIQPLIDLTIGSAANEDTFVITYWFNVYKI